MTVSIDRRQLAEKPPPTWTTARARIAGLRRRGHAADDPAVLDAQRDLRAARLADHAARVAPDLTDEWREHVRAILDGAR